MKGQALKPNFILQNLSSLKTETKEGEPTAQEQAYHAMTMMKGWKQFTDYKDEVIQDMNRINKEAIGQGLSYEQIGQNTIIISMVSDIVDKLFNRVIDAAEAVENNGK